MEEGTGQQVRAHIPAGAYLLDMRVRSYEVTRSGRITTATILRYLEHLATQASAHRGYTHDWYERVGSAWVVRDIQLVFGRLPGLDDQLRMATWLSDFRRVQAFREYAIWDRMTGRLITRAQARWAYVDRYRGVPLRIPDELMRNFDAPGFPMKPHRLQQMNDRATMDTYELTARAYEADSQQHINNCVYADWLDEAERAALRLDPASEPFTIVPRALRIEYIRSAQPGDHVRIETRSSRQSRAIAATQEIRLNGNGTAVVRAESLRLVVPRCSRA